MEKHRVWARTGQLVSSFREFAGRPETRRRKRSLSAGIAAGRKQHVLLSAVVLFLCAFTYVLSLSAQTSNPKVFYFPKPIQPRPYVPPMKPLVLLADLKAKHKGQSNWSELVVQDYYNRVEIISAAPGSKVPLHMHSDSPEYWFVEEGQIRFEIDDPPGKPQIINAGKGSLVFAPERMLHSLEVVGNEPAIRVQVTLAEASPIYPVKPEQSLPGKEYLPATVWTYPNPDDVPNPGGKPDRLYFNLPDMLQEHQAQRSWSDLVIMKNRAHANIICGYAADAKIRPGNRGHFHDFPEIWIVMQGHLKWTIEGVPPFVAGEGDVVYAPATRWHLPVPYGDGPACRLAMTPFPDGNHLFDPPTAKGSAESQ
jgi:mannose-6-phosphate isomerase-like protein (cupin superfamily)